MSTDLPSGSRSPRFPDLDDHETLVLRPAVRPGARPGVLGPGLVVTGDLTASEDLIVSARIDGNVDLPDHALTIAPDGSVKGQVFARLVLVEGRVTGNITATESIELVDGSAVEGDLTAPRVGIDLGAWLQGRIDMRRADAAIRVARYRLERKAAGPVSS